MRATILKLYFANFFIGLVFWYGIEKLFMQAIGIDANQIGLVIKRAGRNSLLKNIAQRLLSFQKNKPCLVKAR